MPKKTFIFNLLVVLLVALSSSLAQATTVTVATFADPSEDSNEPLFTVDFNNMTLNGGWSDEQFNLDLTIFGDSDNPFEDAFFTMTDIVITSEFDPWMGTKTGGGTIKFFEDNTGNPETATPLIQITFDSGHVTPFGLGAMDFSLFGDSGDSVTIIGSEVVGSLTDESFSFSFANQAPLSGDWSKGYTATAAFTSSAVSTTPEPATICLLGLGALSLIRKRRA